MLQEIYIIVTDEEIRAEVPIRACSIHFPNIFGIDDEEKKVVFVGKSRHQVLTTEFMYLREYGKTIDQFIFQSAFQQTAPELEILDIAAVSQCRLRLRQQCLSFSSFTFDLFDYDLEIPGYENWSQARKDRLAYYVQTRCQARKVTMNGHPVEIPLWKRMITIFFKTLLLNGFPLGSVMLIIYFPRSWFSLVWFLCGYFLFLVLGLLVWGYSMKWLVPESYLARLSLPELQPEFIRKIARSIFHVEADV
jgi:hypothetical protein